MATIVYHGRIHEWFKRFQEGREALEDDERSGRPRNVVNDENAEASRNHRRNIHSVDLSYYDRKPHEKDLRIFDYLTQNSHCNHQPFTVFYLIWHPATSTCSENFIWQ